MKTINQIQQQVLETAHEALDELRSSVEKWWEQGWERSQKAHEMGGQSDFYEREVEKIRRHYEGIKLVYSKIVSGEYTGDVDDAKERLEKNESQLKEFLKDALHRSIRRCYFELCGYTFDIPYNPRHDSPAEIHNAELVKSGILEIHPYCNSRQEFETKRDAEVNEIIENSTAKLMNQVEKKLSPIKDSIQSFDLISFKGQRGNYVGEWVVTTDSSKYLFKTSCILAGGYNIQCLHNRYVSSLKQLKK